jgi:tetratricopeptide (TPR) repeat protein
MAAAEAALSSTAPLALTVRPTALAERLRAVQGIRQVQLWRLPYDTWVYRTALEKYADQDPALQQQLSLEQWIFAGTHPLVHGRIQHLRGNFETRDEKPGAKAYYLRARVTDRKLAQLATSEEVQAELGIFRRRENDQEWQALLQAQKAILVRVKRTASYWLGLIHATTGRYEAAVDWLKKRTLDESEDNPWRGGARYNLARIFAAQGEREAARKLLLLDDSPQRHGNLLLARRLRQEMEATEAAEE